MFHKKSDSTENMRAGPGCCVQNAGPWQI